MKQQYVMTVTYDKALDPENEIIERLMNTMYQMSGLTGVSEVKLVPTGGNGSDFVPGVEQQQEGAA